MHRSLATMSLLAAAMLVAAACSGPAAPPLGMVTSGADTADQVFFKVTAPITSNGIRRGVLTADTMLVLDDQTRFDFRVGNVRFYTETGAFEGTMRADRGQYDMRQEVLEGWGNVVVTFADGRSLRSPHVLFRQRTGQISSDTTYEVRRGDQVQRGIGFETTTAGNQFRCFRSCGGSMTVIMPNR
jgi:LPS export ABC transporter protein LptC